MCTANPAIHPSPLFRLRLTLLSILLMIIFPFQWFGTRLRWCSVATSTIAIRQDPRLSPSGQWAAKMPWRRVRCGAVCRVTSVAMWHRFGTFNAVAPVRWLSALMSYLHWRANLILIATDRWWCWPNIRKVLPLVRSNQDECVGQAQCTRSVSTGKANEGNLKYCTAYRWHKTGLITTLLLKTWYGM